MAEFIVNGCAVEDCETYNTWRMSHPRVSKDDSERLQMDWDDSIDEAKRNDPDEWNLGDVIKIMSKNGWTIEGIDTVKVWF